MKKYFGPETIKASKNFPFSAHPAKMEFILAIVTIKKAAAIANFKDGVLKRNVSQAIAKACDEILSGKFREQFCLSFFQGGAGTAIHMNVNEVLAARATELLGGKITVHPNDHVNRGQSTNDVNPTAIKIAANFLLKQLGSNLHSLIKSFEAKSEEFAKVKKLGRTHMQDAVPTTLGAEFSSYAGALKRHLGSLEDVRRLILMLNLGGTAIGNSVNASIKYQKEVYKALNKITKDKFIPGQNLMVLTSDQTDLLAVSQAVTRLTVTLSKIANDFKFMSSGPRGGIGEIILPELQKGSSIMPGKINPIMPETLNQLYYLCSGNNLAIEKAVEGAQMELGVMLPIIADRLLESIQLVAESVRQFDKLCVSEARANIKKCNEHLENSTALATYLTPKFGYDKIAELVKITIKEKKSFKQVVLESNLMNEKEWKIILKNINNINV